MVEHRKTEYRDYTPWAVDRNDRRYGFDSRRGRFSPFTPFGESFDSSKVTGWHTNAKRATVVVRVNAMAQDARNVRNQRIG